MNRNAAAMIIFVMLVIAIFVGYQIALFSFQSQFTVLYSLDKKQNDRALVATINSAQKYVYFAIYEFTKSDIAEALIEAKNRGLTVEGIADAVQSEDGVQEKIIRQLRSAGIPVENQKHTQGIMHIKALVTDNAYAIGSYNWTESATELNDEILEIGTNESLRETYLGIIEKVILANH